MFDVSLCGFKKLREMDQFDSSYEEEEKKTPKKKNEEERLRTTFREEF